MKKQKIDKTLKLQRDSIRIGRSRTYFATVRIFKPVDFRYMKFLGKKDLAKGYFLAKEKMVKNTKELGRIHDKYKKGEITKLLVKHNFYKSIESAGGFLISCSRLGEEDFSYRKHKKNRDILKMLKKEGIIDGESSL